jgi:plastin-3
MYKFCQQLTSAGKQRQISSFSDPSISDAKVVLDLIDAIKSGSVNYDHVKEGSDEEVRYSTDCISVQQSGI